MQITNLAISLIKPYENNPRKNEAGIDAVAKSMREFGVRAPILVDKDHVIIYGHTRFEAAKLNGMTEYPCIIAEDMTPEKARAYRIADNHVATHSEWDETKLKIELESLQSIDFKELPLIEMAPKEFFPNIVSFEVGNKDPDHVPELSQEQPKTKRGDIYKLGNHRLMCGDSTSIDDVEKLMNGEKADMVLTDPPYGIGFEYNQHKDVKGNAYTDFCSEWFNNCVLISDFIVIFTGWSYNSFWCSKEPKDTFYWLCRNKRSGGSISNFRKVEPIYIWGKPVKKYDFDFFDVTTKIDPELHKKHTCPKPVELIEQVIEGSKQGAIVVDLFGGSGTTLIAAEKTGRISRLIEIDPHYCDVIIARWEKYTSKKAELIQ